MKPLRAALIVKNTPSSYERDLKNVGYFSYPVKEFTWEYFSPGKGVSVEVDAFQRAGFDFVLHVDGGNWCRYINPTIPVVYYSIDSTLSDTHHFAPRLEQAGRADLVLIDHDDLDRFQPCGRPVRRWLYCVNDRLFVPREKTLDVDFQCGGSPERSRLRVLLSDLCAAHHLSYKSGVAPLPEYAETMGRARVVVVQPRNPRNRPHRVYDAGASGAAVLTAPLPRIEGEFPDFVREKQFTFHNERELEELIVHLNPNPMWKEPFHTEIIQHHTWATRAAQLRTILAEELHL